MDGVLRLSPWRRAPFLLLRSPAVAGAVAAASAVLVLVVASPTLFVSAVGGAAIRSDIVDGCRYGIGMTLASETPIPGRGTAPDSFEARRRFVDDIAARTPGTTDPVVTMSVNPVDATSGRERPGDGQVQLMSRTGAADHVRWVDGGPGDGVWLPDRTAELLDVGAGDDIAVVIDGARIPAHVDGVFEDLAYVADRGSFWCSTERSFEPFGSYVPPPVALMEEAELTRVLGEAGRQVVGARFEVPPAAGGLPLPVASQAATRLDRGAVAVRADDDPATNPFASGRRTASVGLPGSVAHAVQVGDAVRPLVETVAVAAFVIALLVAAAAGRSWSDARGGEIRLLVSKGVSPAALSVKAALEMAPAAIVGGVTGLLMARLLVESLGPGPLIGADATRRSALTAAAATLVGIVVLAASAMAAVAARDRRDAARRWRQAFPWELVLLALAAIAFVQLRSPAARVSTAAGTSYPADRLLVLFPLLLLCGGGFFAMRLLRRVLPALQRRGRRQRLPILLAARRSGSAGPAALALVVGSALSIGIFLYSSVISASAHATVTAKATLGPGSDLVVFPGTLHETVPKTLTSRASLVVRSETDVDGGERTPVLAVDRRTFARAAFFDPSFATDTIDRLLQRLAPEPGRPIPVLAVGGVPGGDRVSIGGDDERVTLAVVGRPHAFPGQRAGTPMLVIDQEALEGAGLHGTSEMWVRGDPAESIAAIRRSPFDAIHFVRASEGLEASSLLPLATSLDYFRALGLLGGAVTMSGVVLYLMAKERERRLAFVMTRRMGLRTRVAVVANALEVGVLLLVGLVLAALLAVPAAAAVFPHLDPSTGTPPAALVRLDLGLLAAVLAICALVSLAAAVGSVMSSLRRPPAEVMRLVP
jgi:putative ABC transport system permease protein